jgi:hypothetical protein
MFISIRIRNPIKIYSIIFVLSLFVSLNAFAQPNIIGISGTITNGSSITIAGSGFGIKSTAAPLIWDNFEYGSDGDNLDTASSGKWTHYQTGSVVNKVKISTGQHYGGSRSAYNALWQRPDGDEGQEFGTAYQKFSPVDEAYVSMVVRWDTDATGTTSGFWKWFRLNNKEHVYSGVPNIDCTLFPQSSWLAAAQNDGVNYKQQDLTINYAKQIWFRIEYYLKLSTQGGTDGLAQLYVNNSLLPTNLWTATTRGVGIASQLSNLLLPFMWVNGNNNEKYYVWVDDVYVDNTRQRVELCDSSTWNNRTHCEIQIPSVWDGNSNPNSISITVNQGSFTNLNKYLYVVDKDGNVNTNGYSICPYCPNRPINVNVK